MIAEKRIKVSRCISGIYLRWYFNGWHYYCFNNGYEITQTTENLDVMTTQMFSVISKIQRPTRTKTEYQYSITLHNIQPDNAKGFTNLLLAEKVEQYESGWYDVEVVRGSHLIKEENAPGYSLTFQIKRKELPGHPAVSQKSLYFYIGDTLCDLDDDEVIPINRQVNDIAEMEDRQTDFTAEFKIRKTREMRALFELSGEVGANTTFPYENQTCRLIQDGVEMITNGRLFLERSDSSYYYVTVFSGNKSFFQEIEGKKITDLTLASTNHTWDADTQAASNANDYDYCYPMVEPSDDGGIIPLTDTGNACHYYGGYLWPFIKLKAIWDEIFTNAGYIDSGDILTNSVFLKLFMPISNRKIENVIWSAYCYWLYRNETHYYSGATNILPGGTVMIGDANFANGIYYAPYDGTYKFRIVLVTGIYASNPSVYIRDGVTDTALDLITEENLGFIKALTYEGEYQMSAGVDIKFIVGPAMLYYFSYGVYSIDVTAIGYGSPVTPRLHLPDMTQTDFIKLVCNLFGLIPETTPRDKKIFFWNYNLLYENIPLARDWSAYLSEQDDEVEYKFGDYAQNNKLKYAESDDVEKDTGTGTMIVDDETLPEEKTVVELPVSLTDEVLVLTDITTSRIAFNKYDDGVYEAEESIDPRIVYVSQIANTKTFGIDDNASPVVTHDTVSPKVATAIQASFPALIGNYAGLSRLLTRTNLRKAKFNLPVHEVAGFKHYIPIYVSQYKAYFYVNKIENYIYGKLCTIELIKL